MVDIAVQASFNSGEWSPKLFARVDIQKYKSGAALLENFFVDYRGGASTRVGTKYVIQAYKSSTQVRLIPFQASFDVGYVLEFGNGYIRFIYDGQPVVENSFPITAISKANPCVAQITGNNFVAGDWIYIANVVGMTQIDGRYFSVLNVTGAAVTLGDLNGNAINSTAYTTYVSGGTAARIYTIASPYTSTHNLRLLKFSQSVNQMVICHPDFPAYVLTIVTATNWTLNPIVIGTTIAAPTGLSTAVALGLIGAFFSLATFTYVVTTIDYNGQESVASLPVSVTTVDMRAYQVTINISWAPVAGAKAYNVYKAEPTYFGVTPFGVQYGFIGTCLSTTMIDSNIAADFTQSPPTPGNPFTGSGIDYITVTAAGTYTTVPTITFSGSPTIIAVAIAQLSVIGTPTITAGGSGFVAGEQINFGNGFILTVTTVAAGVITAWSVTSKGSITSGSTPSNPIAQAYSSGSGVGATATATWGVSAVILLGNGAGYATTPTVIFSAGTAAATAVLGATSNGNPTVPGFVQQRLVLGGLNGAPETFYASKPGHYFNFDTTLPSKADDSVSATLVSGTLNSIKSIVTSSAGMLVLSDKASWVVNGGAAGAAITPSTILASPQSFVGASDVPPIVANYDILYIQSKGSAVRDLAYNIYFNIFTGTDISVMASHLFYGYTIDEWAWAEHPFYLAQAIRSDGVMLSLTFLKEQEFVGWTHYVTQGKFVSVSTVTELTSIGNVDAVYTVVERVINGNTVKYIERFAEREFTNGVQDAWTVDAALQYVGAPITSFSGMEHLAGMTVTGLADGVKITPFVMPVNGEFTLPIAASKVTIGLGFTCDLQTLGLDTGEPSIQGKVKKITGVNLRVADTLGLSIGSDFTHLVPIKDLIIGNVSGMLTGQSSQIVTGLVTGNAFNSIGPTYTVPGQYCIRQSDPYPATVLGVFPEFVVGDNR